MIVYINKTKTKKKLQTGGLTPALLIISTAFVMAIYGLVAVLSLQFDFSHRQVASDRAFNIADAGVNYYRWHLTEDSEDFTDGNGPGAEGPFVHDYNDPQGENIGKFSLEIEPPTQSNPIITITSTGWTNQYPNIKRTIKAQYGQVSLTRYAFLHNSNLWFGNSVTVNGPVFSNGGIRQDGINTSTVESSKTTYTCGIESGCTNEETKPGVWGNGELDELWSYPKTRIDFESIKVNFTDMLASAETDGLYFEPSGNQGYHLVFESDGDVTVYEVTGVDSIKGYSYEFGCETLYQIIVSETLIGSYPLADTPIIFIEDNVWVDGVVNGKTTVVAAVFPLGSFNPTIWVTENLTYLAKDGNHKLGLVYENDITFGRDVPDDFEINGALLAQNGRTIRHHYGYFGCKSKGNDRLKDEFRYYGSMISSQRSYWNFSSGPQSPASGFHDTIIDYDSTLYDEPPPYFPSTSGQLEFISWTEIKPD